MKKTYLLKALFGSAIIAFASMSHAQDAASAASPSASDTASSDDHGGSPGEYLLKLAGTLGLTDTQIAQIKAIFETSAGQFKTIKNDSSLSDDQKFAQMKTLKDSTEQQIKTILTPEQQQKLEALLHKFMQHHVAKR
jgi:periplasmic protein CpxP/Spy